jgi:hypothetical protein
MLRVVSLGVVTGLLVLVCYQGRVIEGQRVLIRAMTNNPSCLMPK